MIDFVRTNAEVLVALLALVVSCVAIWQTKSSLELQREHNAKSLHPIASLNRLTYRNKIGVELENRGVGPLLVRSISVYPEGDFAAARSNLLDWMPPLESGLRWADYRKGLAGATVPPERVVNLVLLTGSAEDAEFVAFRDKVRLALSTLRIRVEYSDIYDNPFSIDESLSVFAP